MASVLSALGAILAKVLGDNVLRFVAGKALLTALFVVVLPILLNNFLYDLMELFFSWMGDNVSTGGFSGSQSFTGLCAYLIGQFRVSECISVIVSALVLKVTLRHIPFLRL